MRRVGKTARRVREVRRILEVASVAGYFENDDTNRAVLRAYGLLAGRFPGICIEATLVRQISTDGANWELDTSRIRLQTGIRTYHRRRIIFEVSKR